MAKRKKMSGIVLLQHDVEKLIVKPMMRSIRVETKKIQKRAGEMLTKLCGQGKEIEIIARELKRQADEKK
jgi:hypothetical protein